MKKIVFILVFAVFVSVVGLVGFLGVKAPAFFEKVPATSVDFYFEGEDAELYNYRANGINNSGVKTIVLASSRFLCIDDEDEDRYKGVMLRIKLDSGNPDKLTTSKPVVLDNGIDEDSGVKSYELIEYGNIYTIKFYRIGVFTIIAHSSDDTTVNDQLRVMIING